MSARVTLALATLLLAGCSGTIAVTTTIVHPAQIDVSSIPQLTVVHGTEPVAMVVAEELVAELRARGVAVDARSSSAPQESLAGMLLAVDVNVSMTIRSEWVTRPENVCGPYGCYLRNVSQPMDMPYLVAQYAARLEEAGTRRVIETASGVVETLGTGDAQGRRRIARLVMERLEQALAPHEEPVRLAFETIDDDAVDRALEAVRDGAFAEARAALDAAARREGIDDETRARLAYDLALLLAFDPRSYGDATALTSALQSAETSVRLDPTRRHVAALERLRAMSAEARIEDDRRARLASPPTPEVPDAYLGTIPPP